MILFKKTDRKILYEKNSTLTNLANKFEMDKGTANKFTLSWGKDWPEHTCLGYTEVYERYMKPLKEKPIKLCEIGVCDKRFPYASIKMWLSYFKNIDLYAMDNFWDNKIHDKLEDIEKINNWGANFIYANQGSFSDWDDIIKKCSNDFDFVIDDGSHWSNHMMVSLWKSRNLLKSGGYYFMEDIQNPRRTRATHRFDNSVVGEDLLETVHTGIIDSRVLNSQQNEDVNNSFNLIDMILGSSKTLYLAIFKRK